MVEPCESLPELRDAVTVMDCISQEGTSKIQTLAGLALNLLETPQAYQTPEVIARLLITIKDVAEDTENALNGTAERVGCHYIDEAQERRSRAQEEAEAGRCVASRG